MTNIVQLFPKDEPHLELEDFDFTDEVVNAFLAREDEKRQREIAAEDSFEKAISDLKANVRRAEFYIVGGPPRPKNLFS